MSTQDQKRELGVRLRQLRGDQSQEEFAQEIGLTRSALANYETGRTMPKRAVIKEISRRLGMSDDYLISGQVRNEFELNRALTGHHLLSRHEESRDELAVVEAMRAVDPQTVSEVVAALLRDLGENAESRDRLGSEKLGVIVHRLHIIHHAGGEFTKGMSQEQADAGARQLKEIAKENGSVIARAAADKTKRLPREGDS